MPGALQTIQAISDLQTQGVQRAAAISDIQKSQQQQKQQQTISDLVQTYSQNPNEQTIGQIAGLSPEIANGLSKIREQYLNNQAQKALAVKNTWEQIPLSRRANFYAELKKTHAKDMDDYPLEYNENTARIIDDQFNYDSNEAKSILGINPVDERYKQAQTNYYNKKANEPNSDLGGGATGALVKQLMRENPKLSFSDALFQVQTGNRQGVTINDGKVTPIEGLPEVKEKFKESEAKGKTTGEKLGEQANKSITAPVMLNLINEAEKLLPKASSGSIQTTITKGGQKAGISTESSRADSRLKLIAADLTSNIPRMEGPQSDKDTQLYREAAGNVGDSTLPYKDRLAALDQLKTIQQKYIGKQDNVSLTSGEVDGVGWRVK